MKGKKGYIIGLSIIILVFGLFTVKNFIYRAQNDKLISADDITGLKGPKENDNDKLTEVGYVVLNGEKAKAPAFEFIDQNGDTITNEDYAGKVYVVEFFYTSCPTICPIMNQNLLEVSEEFKGNKKFGIASFTIDPKHDTQATLKAYAKKHGITNPNWHLMTGKQSDIYSLARNGFKIIAQEKASAPGGIMHDGMFVLVDKDGYIRSRKDQFGNPIIYYRGYIKRGAEPEYGQHEPQINALIEDIKYLLHQKN